MCIDLPKGNPNWKIYAEYLGEINIEVVLVVFDLDFIESHKQIIRNGAVRADRSLEKARDTIDNVFNPYGKNVAQGDWLGDGKIVIFGDSAQAIHAAQKIIKHRRWENIDQDVRIAISKGSMIFKQKVGRITSEAIICAERLQKDHCKKNNIIITEEIFRTLRADDKQIFKGPRSVKINKPKKSIITYTTPFPPQVLENTYRQPINLKIFLLGIKKLINEIRKILW